MKAPLKYVPIPYAEGTEDESHCRRKKMICLNILFNEQIYSFSGEHYHFVSIARKELAGAINSREHPSIQLNNQWGGKNPRNQ